MWRRLSARSLWLVAPFLGVFLKASYPVLDSSFLWHVRAGELQLRSGAVLTTDPFSFTVAGRSWLTQSWLAEVGYAVLEQWTGGIGWVPAMQAVVGSIVLGLVGLAVHRAGGRFWMTVAAMIAMAWLGAPYLVPRPVLLSYACLALLVVVLQAGGRLGWTVPLVLWVWAGLHGSFVIGLALVVLEGVRVGLRRDRLRTIVVSVLAVGLGAHGWRIWTIPLDFALNRGALEFIVEWGPPKLTKLPYSLYGVLLIGILLAAALGRIRPRDLVVVAPFLILGLSASRSVFPAALVLAPWAARAGERGIERESFRKREPTVQAAVNWTILGVLVVGGMAWAVRPAETHEVFPDRAIALLAADEPTFHDDFVGGYLIYREWPAIRVFVDDRAELYGQEFFAEFTEARNGRGWRETFSRYGITQVLVREAEPLAVVLEEAGWRRAIADDAYVLYRTPERPD